jgi:hypothetical protein
MAGCRDCRTCTMSVIIRGVRGVFQVWWVWLPKLLMRTCPQCSHTLRRHRYRSDGSFRD